MEKSKEEAFAYEIASKLDDLKSIDWHLYCAKHYNWDILLDKLQYVLSKKDVDSPAKYYTFLVKLHYGKRTRN